MAIDKSGLGDIGGEGNIGSTALVDKDDTALADVGGIGNAGGKGDRGGTAPIRYGGSNRMSLICTVHLAQLLRQ